MLLYNIRVVNGRSGGVLNYRKYEANKYECTETFTARGFTTEYITRESNFCPTKTNVNTKYYN